MQELLRCAWRLTDRSEIHTCGFPTGNTIGPYTVPDIFAWESNNDKYIRIDSVVAALVRDKAALIAYNCSDKVIIVITPYCYYSVDPMHDYSQDDRRVFNEHKHPIGGIKQYTPIGYLRTPLLYESAMQYPYYLLRETSTAFPVQLYVPGITDASDDVSPEIFYTMMEKGADAAYRNVYSHNIVLCYKNNNVWTSKEVI